MSSDFNFNFCYVRLPVEQNRENTYFINPSINSFKHSEHWIDFYSIIHHEDRIVPNLDTLLTYAHDSVLATAAKQK